MSQKSSEQAEITCVSSREVYRNRWMRVREDQVVRASGQPGIYGVVEKQEAAVVVPLGPEGLHLVEQYRYPVSGRYWEFPQGCWEQQQVDPLTLARGELREETGLFAGEMQFVAHLFFAYGYSNQGYSIYLATQLEPGEAQHDPEEEGLISRAFPVAEVERMIIQGEIKDATTVAVFGMLRLRGLL